MTDKQEKILNAALELFAKEGFKNTATNKISKKAGVSEGLIFRHFTNKDGLLEAIIKEGEEKFKLLYANIVLETDAKKVIEKVLNLGRLITSNVDDFNFWKLQYKLKWELELYDARKIEPLERALTTAFTDLKYNDPKMEAHLLLILLDGLATRMFLESNFNVEEAVFYLQKKYKV